MNIKLVVHILMVNIRNSEMKMPTGIKIKPPKLQMILKMEIVLAGCAKVFACIVHSMTK